MIKRILLGRCFVVQYMRRSRNFCQRFFKGSEAPKTTKSGQLSACQQNTIEMAFRWRADNGPLFDADLAACDFQGIQTSISRKPFKFVIFQGGSDPLSPSGSAHAVLLSSLVLKSVHWGRES